MAVFKLTAYSNADLGRSATSISTGFFFVSGAPSTMRVTDNDGMFDDENSNGGQTVDFSQQLLASDFDGAYSAGQVVQSVYRYDVTNFSTGQTGNAYLIRIYNGSDPNARGAQDGNYYNAFDIPVNQGDIIRLASGNFVGQVPFANLAVICFAAQTRILTDRGERPIASLREGDRIATRDNGYVPLRWIGCRSVPAEGPLAPIHIAKGALGNSRDLMVSPNHRMLIEGVDADLCFSEPEVLVSAKHLAGSRGITRRTGGHVTYMHLLFDRHEIVWADGAPSESFFPGSEALNALEEDARREVHALFPELVGDAPGDFAQTARLCLNKRESRVLCRA